MSRVVCGGPKLNIAHLTSIREGMVIKCKEHQSKLFQTQMFQEIKE